MQTLKTAAIVVLMMTVMYSAYVSLTTPPEPLPEDVQSMLEFNEEDSLAIDSGLPASLGELEINGGEAVSSPAGASPSVSGPNSGPSLGATAFGSPTSGTTATASAEQISSLTESDVPGSGAVSTTFSDMAVSSSEPGVPPVASSPSYPSTGSTFDLPDPNSVATSFPGSGAPAAQPSDLALASGTSEQPNGMSPAAAAIQTAELPSAATVGNPGLANALNTADDQYMNDRRSEALATLSIFYNAPNLSGEQRSELVSRLDPLAREVIYSRRHLLEQPYRVGQNETLMDIAARYEVPWQLLANINQIKDPVTILPGTEMKVVRGHSAPK